MLENVDLSLTLDSNGYKGNLKTLEVKLGELQRRAWELKIPIIFVFEGWHASGMGEEINRFILPLDPRGYDFHTIDKEYLEDELRPFLMHFWTLIPKKGRNAIFDRSWYGRVLVERVERFCNEGEWKRAYREINEFENILTGTGTIILKFWLHIDKDTQLERFNLRHSDPQKSWKITDEDWRNRNKWEDYTNAIDKMLKKTSTINAQWTVVESNDKRYSRIKILKTVAETLENELKK